MLRFGFVFSLILASFSVNGQASFTNTSILNDGEIYKISVSQDGIHKIDYNFLQNSLGIDLAGIAIDKIKIYGNGRGMLREFLMDERKDDLQEIPYHIEDGGDGTFNESDFILFYANGPHRWEYSDSRNQFLRETNVYSNTSSYFVKIGDANRTVIESSNSLSGAEISLDYYHDHQRFEEDQQNLLAEYTSTLGSGQHWVGDEFGNTNLIDYSDKFDFSDAETALPVRTWCRFYGRSNQTSVYKFSVGDFSKSKSIGAISTGNPEAKYCNTGNINEDFTLSTTSPPVSIEFIKSPNASVAQGWLDYIDFTIPKSLNFKGGQKHFRNIETKNVSTAEFVIDQVNPGDIIWDVTDINNVKSQEYEINGNKATFGFNTDSQIREYVIFNKNASFPAPSAIGQIENQNLHGLVDVDMLLVYHPSFIDEAKLLAEHRSSHSDLKVEMVELSKIYNEFSSGSQDPTAIRDLAKMLYDRENNFRFILLFGDGSYDFRGLETDIVNQNFVPVYETDSSFDPVDSYPSDDYFALLSDEDGEDIKSGKVDVAIGRIPARTSSEARIVVNKIIAYDTDIEMRGSWRVNSVFISDDEDGDLHLEHAEEISDSFGVNHPSLNRNKIYIDAFRQEGNSGGDRYPDAQEEINRKMTQGHLLTSYIGHGGTSGWAQERILTVSDIQNWNNKNELTILVTATCSFTGFDEPRITSAGELCLLSPKGGAVALLSTVRAVLANSNKRLAAAVYANIVKPIDGRRPTLGEAMMFAKNSNQGGTFTNNSRKFILMGDPSMEVGVPLNRIKTTSINSVDINDGIDTLSALEKVTVSGEITDIYNNSLSSFDGVVEMTVFDKEVEISTLANDNSSSVIDFEIQDRVVFRGTASVIAGKFDIEFVVPKDINLSFGNGRISYYAYDSDLSEDDAMGYYEEIIVGGSSDVLGDNEGPIVELFMDSEAFEFGDETGPSPLLIAKISDDFGINVVGNSIGHDLTGILDNDNQNSIILNEFYESLLDDYTEGRVEYRLQDLDPGLHKIRVKAWDTSNNSSEGFTEFYVTDDLEIILTDLMNYPNPVTDGTTFRFSHNLPDTELYVSVSIYTRDGVLVKYINTSVIGGEIVDDIEWDGFGEGGKHLPQGLYVYRIDVTAPNANYLKEPSAFFYEKLVLLK